MSGLNSDDANIKSFARSYASSIHTHTHVTHDSVLFFRYKVNVTALECRPSIWPVGGIEEHSTFDTIVMQFIDEWHKETQTCMHVSQCACVLVLVCVCMFPFLIVALIFIEHEYY